MGLVVLRCPRCFAAIGFDDGREIEDCIVCGSTIGIEEAAERARSDPVSEADADVLKDRMFDLFNSGDVVGAHRIVRLANAVDASDADAWYMDGVCTIDESEYPVDTDSVKDAMASFGRFTLLTGLSVDIDTEAFKRYLDAADKGDPASQRRVGIMYSYGMGVPRSQEKAMEWFRKAYLNGMKDIRDEIVDAIRWTEAEDYTAPSFIGGIWDGMFEGTSFRTVTVPEPISRIGDRAFACCGNLESVRLPSTLRSSLRTAIIGVHSSVH